MQRDIDRIVVVGPIELRAAAQPEARGTIHGYAALYDVETEIGEFREVLRKGCFDRVLASQPDVLARAEHDSALLLGRTSSGTCRVGVDAKGLWYEVDLPDTTAGRDVEALCKRRDLKGSSFAFVVTKEGQTWTRDSRGLLREITEVEELVDVAPTATPAYAQTTVSARALEQRAAMTAQEETVEKPKDQTTKAERRAHLQATREKVAAEQRMVMQGSGYGCPCCRAGTCGCCPEYSFAGCACCASGQCPCCKGADPCAEAHTCSTTDAGAEGESAADSAGEARLQAAREQHARDVAARSPLDKSPA